MKSRKIVSIATILLLEAELFIIIGSWVGSVLFPDSGIVSMISSEGVRWLVGSFAGMLSTPYIIYIILIGMTLGIIRSSGFVADMRRKRAGASTDEEVKDVMANYSERLAVRLALATLTLGIIVILLLTLLPHAILLNSNGDVFNSSFSRGIIPMLCLVISISAGIYGLCTSHITLRHSIADAFAYGIARISPLILLYILVAQIYFTLQYVM